MLQRLVHGLLPVSGSRDKDAWLIAQAIKVAAIILGVPVALAFGIYLVW